MNNIYLTVYISKQFLIQSSVSKWIILLHHIQVYLYLYMFYELFQYIISRLILVHLSYPKNIFIHWPIKQFLCNFFSYALLFTENRKKIQISLHIRFILFNFWAISLVINFLRWVLETVESWFFHFLVLDSISTGFS